MNQKNQKPINIWDKVAPTFGKIGPKYWQYFGSRLVELSNISKGAKILDIGMGRGASLFPAIAKAGKDGYAIGIDISEVMVKETQKDILEHHIDNTEVIRMNAESLDFENNLFDNVICGFGIGYILANDNKLAEIQRVLKIAGQAGFSVWGVQEDQRWLTEIVNKYLPAPLTDKAENTKADSPAFNTMDGMRAILENAGFRNINIHQETEAVIYGSMDEWWQEMWSNAVRAVFERIEELGADRLEEFKADVFEGLKKYKKAQGFHFNMPVIYAFGEK